MITIEKLYEGRNGRALAWALYSVCALFLLSPALDLLAAITPAHPGNIQWRFGLMISVAPTIMTGVISLAMFAVLGVLFGHRSVLQTVGGVTLVMATIYLSMIAVFAMDLLQLRRAVPSDRQLQFWITSAKCLAQIFTGAFALGLLGLGSFRVTRQKTGAAAVEGGGRSRGPQILASRPPSEQSVLTSRTPTSEPTIGSGSK